MNLRVCTLALAGAGLMALPNAAKTEEKPSPVLTGLATTTISGFVDTSMHWNPGTGNANLPIYTPNGVPSGTKADGFNLDVVALTFAKPPGEGDWAAGYNVTLLFGPDAVGYNNSAGSNPSDFSLKDTYVDLHVPIGTGLDVKLGTYTEIIGYEVFEAGNNPNYTRSYGYALEPTQMTGALATYAFGSALTAMFGICDAWNAGVNARSFPPQGNQAESFKTYMGMLTFTAPTNMSFLAGSTLSIGAINGFDGAFVTGAATPSGANVSSYYVGGTINTPVKGLKVGVAWDDLDVHGRSGENWSIGGYLAYQATEKLSFYARGEYMEDRGPSKLFMATTTGPGGVPVLFATMPDKAMELTLTAQYDLWKNVMSRVEVRWDHALNAQGVWGGTTTGAGTQDNAVLVAANVIYKF